jgi:HSP20 family protein
MADKSTEQSASARGSQSSPSSGAAAQQTSARPSQGQGPQAQGTQGQRTQTSEATREQQAARASGAMQRRSSLPFMGTFAASPFSLMRRMMEDLDRMFEDLGSTRSLSGTAAGNRARGGIGGLAVDWSPAIELLERDGQLVVRAELPGLSPEDVRIEITNDGSLVIEGERRSEMEAEEEGGVYRSERIYGRFSRVIDLPQGVDVDRAQARFENGVLEIALPLSEQSQRRRIQIQGQGASGSAQEGPARTGPVH